MVSATEGNITAVYNYNNLGHRTSTVISVGGTTAAQTTYTYNLAGLATTLVNKNGADETLSSFTCTYAADGNILTEVANTGTTETTTYTYDLLGRLIAEVGNAGTRFYTYDTAGNRTQAIVDTDTTVCYTYNSDGELTSETSNNGATSETTLYEYDANGNLTKKTKGISVTNYAYDIWNRMTSADNASYAYNAQGLRVSKTVGGETDSFTLVGGNVWADSEHNYTRGIELVSNGTQLYLYNVRGDVIQLLGFDGDVDKTYDYDAYGNEYARDLGDENPFRYCGEYYDTETGFIYLRARYYDPMVGRFTSVDPIKDGLNWYSYCYNNPVRYADPSGNIPIDVVVDLVSLCLSYTELVNDPSWANWGYFAWDFASIFIPYFPGSYAAKVTNYLNDGVRVVSKADNYVKSGVWLLNAFDRGWEIERRLGGMCNNFPTIDKFVKSTFEDGVQYLSSITSIKSMDTTSKTYQDANKMYRKLVKYIDDLSRFSKTSYKGVEYMVEDGATRILELAIPLVELTPEQVDALNRAIEHASRLEKNSVELIIHMME